MKTMNLKSELSQPIENPTAEDIRRLIWDDDKRGGFKILSKADLTYIQFGRNEPPFGLEYQQGSLDAHFETTEIQDKTKLEEVFVWYLMDDPRWQLLDWKKMTL
jgi:hypothetical protein